MAVLLVFTAFVAAALAVVALVLQRRIRALETGDEGVEVIPRRGDPVSGRREVDAIVVEITNHAQVATSRTLLARPLAAFTPGLIRSIVNKEALRIMREQLVNQGVEADVRIRRVRLPGTDTPTRTMDPEPVDPEPVDPVDELDDWLHNDGDNPFDTD